jgi:hypothetical protein
MLSVAKLIVGGCTVVDFGGRGGKRAAHVKVTAELERGAVGLLQELPVVTEADRKKADQEAEGRFARPWRVWRCIPRSSSSIRCVVT